MVYSQTRRTASISSIVNKNQGGGNKKAGFPYIIGRTHWTNVYFGTLNNQGVGRTCCNTKLSDLQRTLVFTKTAPRNIGSDPRIRHY